MVPSAILAQGKAAKLVRLPIGDLATWQLVCSCGACRQDRLVHVGELVDRCGPERTLLSLMPRLRCSACRRAPSRVMLRNRYPAALGGAGFVEVALV